MPRPPLLCVLRQLAAVLAVVTLAGCSMLGSDAETLADHPLAGRIWDARAERFVDEAQVLRRLRESRFVLLGETHDNGHHHDIQVRLLAAVAADGRRPALVMEQIDTEHQDALDRALRDAGRSPDTVAEAGQVNRKGWNWPVYEPLVAIALARDLPIVAANLSRNETRRIAAHGLSVLGDERLMLLGLDAVWGQGWRQARMDRALIGGHCGQAPTEYLAGLSLAQRAKDAVMAESVGRNQERGAVAILGRGHVRADIGVPAYLAHQRPGVPVLSVALAEVEKGLTDPRRYAYFPDRENAEPLYDLVWFTPRVPREDPCVRFNAARLKAAAGGAAPAAPPPAQESARPAPR